MSVPNYLSDHDDTYAEDPHAANMEWFANADYGLFLHYGLYSQLGRHEWVMFREQIPIAEYEKLADSFDPSGFDADFITDLACEGGMKYVNLTSCHHEGFCLWDCKTEPHYNSMKFAGRDLVRELGEQCDKKGLGFFTYYTHVLNWRHPYSLTTDLLWADRPHYEHDEPRYILTKPEEWRTYWDYSQSCIKELCELDYPIAGIWLDIIKAYYEIPDLIPIEQTYEIIRASRPDTLISFKQGATGTEDYASPEFHFRSQGDKLRDEGKPEAAERADKAWAANKDKHNEICMTIQNGSWGWHKENSWKPIDELWSCLGYARANNCNLLANIGPMPDGSIPEEAAKTVREVGRRIEAEGMPAAEQAAEPQRNSNAAGTE